MINTQKFLVHLRKFVLIFHFYLIVSVIQVFAKFFFPKEALESPTATDTFWYQNYVEFFYRLEVLKSQISKSYVNTCKFKNCSGGPICSLFQSNFWLEIGGFRIVRGYFEYKICRKSFFYTGRFLICSLSDLPLSINSFLEPPYHSLKLYCTFNFRSVYPASF